MRVAAFESYRNDVKGEQCGALCKLGKFFFCKIYLLFSTLFIYRMSYTILNTGLSYIKIVYTITEDLRL